METKKGKVIILTGPNAGDRVEVPRGRKLQKQTVTDADAIRILEAMEGKTKKWETFLRKEWKNSEQTEDFPEAKEEDTRSYLNRATFGLLGSGGESKTDTAAPSASSAPSGGESKSDKPAAPAETGTDKRALLRKEGARLGKPFGLNGNSKSDDIEVALKVIAAVGDSDAKRFYKLYKHERTMLGVIETSSQDVYSAKTTAPGKMNSILKGTYVVCLDDKTDGWCKTVIIDPRSEKGLENKDVVKADGIYYIQKTGRGNFYTYVKHDVDLVDAAEVLTKKSGKRFGLGLWEQALKTPKESAASEESAAASEESAAAEWTPKVGEQVNKMVTNGTSKGISKNGPYTIKDLFSEDGVEKVRVSNKQGERLKAFKLEDLMNPKKWKPVKKASGAEASGVGTGVGAALGSALGAATGLVGSAIRKTAGAAAGAVSSLGAGGDAAEAPAEETAEEDLNKLTKEQLKERLRQKKLKVSGNKSDLITRLKGSSVPKTKKAPDQTSVPPGAKKEYGVGDIVSKIIKGKKTSQKYRITGKKDGKWLLQMLTATGNDAYKKGKKSTATAKIGKIGLQDGAHFEVSQDDLLLHYDGEDGAHFELGGGDLMHFEEGMSEGMIDE